MAYRAMTQTTYELLKAAFIEKPGVILHAATTAGVAPKTAKRAWETGWPVQGFKPLRLVWEDAENQKRLAEENERLTKLKAEQEQRQLLRSAAISTLEQESQMMNAARQNVRAGINMITNLARAVVSTVAPLSAELADPKAVFTPHQRFQFAKDMSLVMKRMNESVLLVIMAQRKYLGEPDTVIVENGAEEMGPEEAALVIQRSQRALERALRSGLVLPAGGQTVTVPSNGNGSTGGDNDSTGNGGALQ